LHQAFFKSRGCALGARIIDTLSNNYKKQMRTVFAALFRASKKSRTPFFSCAHAIMKLKAVINIMAAEPPHTNEKYLSTDSFVH
jgi:hypothetical protein